MPDKNARIAVLVPCYNESMTVAKVVKDFRAALPEAVIYVYDNNSTDDTAEIARQAGAIVRHETRQGKGNVIRSMFRKIDADCYLMVDGDDTYPADNAREMCDLVLQRRADMVIGDRLSTTYFTVNTRRFHNFGNLLVQSCAKLFHRGIPNNSLDVMSGYRAFSPLFVKMFPVLSQSFEIETEMTVHALHNNFLLASVPINYRDRPAGSVSKLNTILDGIKVLLMIFNLYRLYKPLYFFGVAAMIFALMSVVLFIPVFTTWLDTGLVPRLPTLVVSGLLMLSAFLSMACGWILDTIMLNHRKNFELPTASPEKIFCSSQCSRGCCLCRELWTMTFGFCSTAGVTCWQTEFRTWSPSRYMKACISS